MRHVDAIEAIFERDGQFGIALEIRASFRPIALAAALDQSLTPQTRSVWFPALEHRSSREAVFVVYEE